MGTDDGGGCAVGSHVRERVAELLRKRGVAIFAKGDALCLAAEAHVQQAVFAGIVVKILLQRALHAGGGIDIAAAQRGEDLPELGVGRELGESGELVIQSVGQDVLGGGARLHGDTLTRKVLDRADPAVRAHDDHTLGVEVGPGPEKLVLTAIHRQAAPQTVDIARGKTGKALIERDLAKNGLIADPTAGRGRNLHVDACVAAAHTA